MKARFILLTLTLVAGCNEEPPHTPAADRSPATPAASPWDPPCPAAARQTSLENSYVRVFYGPFFGVNLGESIDSLSARYTVTPMKTDDPDDPSKKWKVETGDPDLMALDVRSLDGTVFEIAVMMRDDSTAAYDAVKRTLEAKYGPCRYKLAFGPYWKVRHDDHDAEIQLRGDLLWRIVCIDVTTEAELTARIAARKTAKLKGKL